MPSPVSKSVVHACSPWALWNAGTAVGSVCACTARILVCFWPWVHLHVTSYSWIQQEAFLCAKKKNETWMEAEGESRARTKGSMMSTEFLCPQVTGEPRRLNLFVCVCKARKWIHTNLKIVTDRVLLFQCCSRGSRYDLEKSEPYQIVNVNIWETAKDMGKDLDLCVAECSVTFWRHKHALSSVSQTLPNLDWHCFSLESLLLSKFDW